MGLRIKLIAFVLGILFLGVVLRHIRQNTFRPVYGVLWLLISVFLLSITVLEPVYRWIAVSLIGINDARHIIYIAVIGFLLVYNLYLTSMVSRMSNQIRQLISSLAVLASASETSDKARGETRQ
jgi:hypothetical protein